MDELIDVNDSVEQTNDQDFNDTYFQLSPQALTGQFSPLALKNSKELLGVFLLWFWFIPKVHTIYYSPTLQVT